MINMACDKKGTHAQQALVSIITCEKEVDFTIEMVSGYKIYFQSRNTYLICRNANLSKTCRIILKTIFDNQNFRHRCRKCQNCRKIVVENFDMCRTFLTLVEFSTRIENF